MSQQNQDQRGAPTLPELKSLCERARTIPRDVLIGHAVARGCFHYAPFVAEDLYKAGDFPPEVLGCALLIGPEDTDTFQAIRCGAMVLSDLGNNPLLVAAAAKILGVENRVLHIARTGLAADNHPEFWQTLIQQFPDGGPDVIDDDFMPGISRFTLETAKRGPSLGSARHWLRTDYKRCRHE